MGEFTKPGVQDISFHPSPTNEMDSDEVQRENLQLLIDIAKLCNRRGKKNVENIFLLGKPGAGKSALINTVIKALTGEYVAKAKVGAGLRQSKTLTLESFKSCGVEREDIKAGCQQDIVESILHKLPTIFDAAGRDDPDTYDNPEGVEEILELFIGGFIPPGTGIEGLEELQKKHGVGCLRDDIYTESKKEWKMTKVVFVQSCRDTIPSELIKSLDKILRKTDPKTAQPKYPAEVFVVITKYDLVEDKREFDSNSDPNSDTISMKTFQDVEKQVTKLFSIKGALEDNLIRWVSYTDGVNKDNPYIDNIALKFLKLMLRPGNRQIESVPTVITPYKQMKLKLKKECKNMNFSPVQMLIWVLLILLAYMVYKLLTAKPH